MTHSYMQLSGTIAEQLKEELGYSFDRMLDIEVIAESLFGPEHVL